jgi:hypothetical protein
MPENFTIRHTPAGYRNAVNRREGPRHAYEIVEAEIDFM